MINKQVESIAAALEGIQDGSTVLSSGFGAAGEPVELLNGLLEQGARDLVIVSNNAGTGDVGLAALIRERRVRKIICSYPRSADPHCFDECYRAGNIEVELLPQGTLSERIRAGAAGISAFYVQVGAGTELSKGKETREFDGKLHVMEKAIHGDLALVRALRADRWGNLIYRKSARNFNPVMAMAADRTVVQTNEICPLGSLDPEAIHTPGIFVNRVVCIDPNQEVEQ
ncbi:3-oxoacid CoA-transferase subunit A [Pacificibacter marinus]|uniref:3-oxoacid CoA-transferase subunit A n=1 Tax=Pacificibacter marinus TaxID=658057 RepID=UPI001C0657BE|nr:3-oxoacid CoA-transferase subunit A [Pacificibacter marinus]MBU2867493.1 3-oxoacid CoA-transferase subunit A [Pacificibacter marinus]